MSKGANINVYGPFGNPLELLWRLANSSDRGEKMCETYQHIIRHLIRKGAVNNRPDPNGLVPTVEFMENWATNSSRYEECMRIYHHGPTPVEPGS